MGSLTVGRVSGGFVVRLRGHGTLREGRALSEFAGAAPAGSRLDLDLSAADWLDSTFLGSLMGLHKRMNLPPPARFRVCAEPVQIKKLVGKTRLDTVLCIAPRPAEVVGPEETMSESVLDSATLTHFIADCHRRLAELGGPDSAAFSRVAEALEPPGVSTSAS